MIDLEREVKLLKTQTGVRVCAERLQLWLLCPRASCRRGRACRDAPRCGARLAAWVEGIKAVRSRYDANPEADAMRLDLTEKLMRLAQSKQKEDEPAPRGEG